MDKTYRGKEIPRFTEEDTMRFVEKHAGIRIRPNLTFADFWKTTDNYSFVCLEEGVFKLWTWGRIACVGDSVHKMTPNIGAGGNAGIESAATLANSLKWLADNMKGERPSTEMVEQALQRYQKQREGRAGIMVRSAGEITRMQAGQSLYHRFAAKIVRLYPGDFIADYLSGYFSGAIMLVSQVLICTGARTDIIFSKSYLPAPKASLDVLQPFNPAQGWLKAESRTKRALLALPFFLTFFLAINAMDVSPVIPMLSPMLSNSTVAWDSGSVPLRTTFYNIKRLDDM
jgi:hypothetical protein